MKTDEKLCTNCGKCCYQKIYIGRTVFITPFPCEYLDTQTNLCTIYDRRHELNPNCLSIEEGLKVSAFPADCPYVEEHAPPKYKPARTDRDWAREWDEFDEFADDLEIPPEVREKVRARGPHAAPMHEEAYARIKKQREHDLMIWGNQSAAVVDIRTKEDSANVPSIVNMIRG